MKKYVVIFRWFNDSYCTELLMRRSYHVKANNPEEAGHKAFEKFDKEFNLQEDHYLNIIDEISIRDLKFKRKHIKDRFSTLYSL